MDIFIYLFICSVGTLSSRTTKTGNVARFESIAEALLKICLLHFALRQLVNNFLLIKEGSTFTVRVEQ